MTDGGRKERKGDDRVWAAGGCQGGTGEGMQQLFCT